MTRVTWLVIIVCFVSPSASSAAQDQFFDSNGVKIRYVEQGAGAPIVLVHGYSSNLDETWIGGGAFQALARDYRVIALDCRGHGKSERPHDPRQYGPEMGRDVIRLLDHLGVRKAHIVGYSMGGNILARLLTEHPERFLSATLAGASGRRRWSAADDWWAETVAAEMEQGSMRSLLLRLAPPNEPKPTDEEIRKRSAEQLAGQDPIALAAITRANRDTVVTDAQMAAVKVPTLAIIGSADPGLAGVYDLKRVMAALKVVVIEGATHMTAVSRPEFVRALRDFIASYRTGSSR